MWVWACVSMRLHSLLVLCAATFLSTLYVSFRFFFCFFFRFWDGWRCLRCCCCLRTQWMSERPRNGTSEKRDQHNTKATKQALNESELMSCNTHLVLAAHTHFIYYSGSRGRATSWWLLRQWGIDDTKEWTKERKKTKKRRRERRNCCQCFI